MLIRVKKKTNKKRWEGIVSFMPVLKEDPPRQVYFLWSIYGIAIVYNISRNFLWIFIYLSYWCKMKALKFF